MNNHLYKLIDNLESELQETRKRLADEIKVSRSRDRANAVYCQLLIDTVDQLKEENDAYRDAAARINRSHSE